MKTTYEPIPDDVADVRLPVPVQDAASTDSEEDNVVKLTAPIEYDPRSWKDTFLVLRGRPFLDGLYGVKRTGISALLTVWAVGSALVAISALIGYGSTYSTHPFGRALRRPPWGGGSDQILSGRVLTKTKTNIRPLHSIPSPAWPVRAFSLVVFGFM
jgi:hypothetical protein